MCVVIFQERETVQTVRPREIERFQQLIQERVRSLLLRQRDVSLSPGIDNLSGKALVLVARMRKGGFLWRLQDRT